MQTEQVKNKYNKEIEYKYNGDYERERWFKNDIQRAGYEMTLGAIKKHAFASIYASCFELGPGHGTWTKELLVARPNAEFDLVDISSKMLGLAKAKFKDNHNINYFEADFLKFNPKKKYDFFFSSRAIEYLPNKEQAVKKIVDLLAKGGSGFIITKTPKYLRNKILGRKTVDFHSGQIKPEELTRLLKNNGCQNIKVYPATMSWPFWQSAKINFLLFDTFKNFRLNFLSRFFTESYAIKFIKK